MFTMVSVNAFDMLHENGYNSSFHAINCSIYSVIESEDSGLLPLPAPQILNDAKS